MKNFDSSTPREFTATDYRKVAVPRLEGRKTKWNKVDKILSKGTNYFNWGTGTLGG